MLPAAAVVTLADLLLIVPEMVVFGMGLVVLLFDLSSRAQSVRHLASLSLLTLGAAGLLLITQLGHDAVGFSGMFRQDNYAILFKTIFLVIVGSTLLIATTYLEQRRIACGEFYALMLFACGAMMLMASAAHFLLIFLGLEILSITSYILCGMLRSVGRSNEAALKYFLLGAFATAFLLYGAAMLYGATGSLQLQAIGQALYQEAVRENPYVWCGLALILIGFGFKIALVPFHMWTPDVYQGAPTPVTAFFSAGPKAAGFAVLARVLMEALPTLTVGWIPVLWVLAVASMTLGNVMAIQQDNIKRMLAYSSIAHGGYMLVALIAHSAEGLAGLMLYALAYTFMNAGAFAIVILASQDQPEERLSFSDFRGFGYVSPLLGLAMLLFMLSLAGIPLTAGFLGKFQIFKSAIEGGYFWLTVIALLNSVVSIFYYLRIVVSMYMQPPSGKSLRRVPVASAELRIAVALAAAFTLYLGIFPSRWIDLASQAAVRLASGG